MERMETKQTERQFYSREIASINNKYDIINYNLSRNHYIIKCCIMYCSTALLSALTCLKKFFFSFFFLISRLKIF